MTDFVRPDVGMQHARQREQLRRAVQDGERLYRKRMHDEPSVADDHRINGILTRELVDSLALVDALLASQEATLANPVKE